MEIKKAEENDFEEILAMIKEEFPYVSFDSAKIRERVEKRGIRIFKAAEGKELLGFIEIESLEEGIARINGLSVKPEHRNRGIAKKLLEFTLGLLKKEGVQRVLLLVKQGNEAAKKIYEEAGFSFIGMYHREIDQAVVEELEFDFAPKGERPSYVG